MSRGAELLKSYNDRKKNREAEDASLSSSSRGRELYERYTSKRAQYDFDEFNRTATENQFDGNWHTQSDMDQYIADSKSRYTKATELSKKYGDLYPNIKDLPSQYAQNASALSQAKDSFSNYLNADAYNKARRGWELDEKYKGKSYDEIKKAYDTTTDEDEKDYLKSFTKYSSLADYDKALSDKNDFDKASIKDARSSFATMNYTQNYRDLLNDATFNEAANDTSIDNQLMLDEMNYREQPTLKTGFKKQLEISNTPTFGMIKDEDKKKIARGIYKTQGLDKYLEFMENARYELSNDWSQSAEEKAAEWGKDNKIAAGLAYVVGGTANDAANAIREGVGTLAGVEANPYVGTGVVGRVLNSSNAAATEDIQKNNPSITMPFTGNEISVADLYSASTQGLKNRLEQAGGMAIGSVLSGGNPKIGQKIGGTIVNSILGTSAYTQAYGDYLREGYSKEEAKERATVDGAIEFITETIGMDWAFSWMSDKNVGLSLLKQTLGEAGEEVLGNVLKTVYDVNRFKDKSEYNKTIDAYIAKGYTESEARELARKDWIKETSHEAWIAGLSAGLSGGVQAVKTTNTGRNVDFGRLGEAINTYNPDSETKELYDKLLGKYSEGDRVPNWNKGMVAQQAYSDARTAYDEAVKSGDAQAIDNALMNRYALDEAFKTGEEMQAERDNRLVNRAVQSVRSRFQKNAETKEQTAEQTEQTENGEVIGGGEQSTRVSENSRIAQEEMQKALNKSLHDKYLKDYTEVESKLFDANVNEEKLPLYKANFDYVINAAHRQTDLEEVLQHVTPSAMKQSTAIDIYNAIRANDAEVGRVATEANSKVISKWDGEYSKKGTLTVSVDNKDLTKEDKRILGLVTALTHMGMDINVIKNKNEENGWVTDKDNKITLNLAAQYFKNSDPSKGRYVINTLAHESTHWMENVLGKEEFSSFKNLIRSSVGVSKWNQMVGLEIARAKEDGSKMDIDTAESEATARFCEDMLNDMTVADKIFQTASHSQLERIANAIKEFFTKIRNDLRDWMKGYDSKSEEARLLRSLDKSFKEVQDQWAELFKRALAVNQVQEYKSVEAKAIDAVYNGNQEAAEELVGDVVESRKNSMKLNDDLADRTVEANNKYHNVNPLKLNRALAMRKGKVVIPLKALAQYLPEDIEGEIIVGNQSYSKSVEHALVCIRSLVNEWFIDNVSNEIGRPLTIEEQIVASEILAQKVSQRECQYCYVAADRKAFRAAFGNYFNDIKAVQDKALANREQYQNEIDFIREHWDDFKDKWSKTTNRKKFVKSANFKNLQGFSEMLRGRAMTFNMVERYYRAVSDALEGKTRLEGRHLATDENRIEASKDEVLGWYIKDATAYAKSASHAKLTTRSVKIDGVEYNLDYIAYNGSILDMSEEVVKDLNDEYGLRLYSDSDYVPAFILEDMQVVTDAAVRGLKMLAYTKDLGFAKVFAPSGMNINVSTYGVLNKDYKTDEELNRLREEYHNNKNDKTRKAYLDRLNKYVVSDAMQGAEWDDVKEIRKQYNNVGAIFVAYNDDLVEWALAQDWIDVVIPYHVVYSQGTKEFFEYTDYKQEQGDKKKKGWKAENDKAMIPPTMHENDFEKYKEALEKNHLTMRFAKWADNPNYMKLVNETRLSYKETPAVQPEFDYDAIEEEIARIPFEGKYGYDRGINNLEEQERTFKDEFNDAVRLIKEGKTTKEDLEAYLSEERKMSRRVNEISEDTYDRMKKHFGTTYNYNVAGYMLNDGTMLDFSGKHWGDTTSRTRQVDHRDISEVLLDNNNGVTSMVDMIGNGNIRLEPEIGGINLAVAPNDKQKEVLRKYIRHHLLSGDGEIVVDFDEKGGDTVYTMTYEVGDADADKILEDIDNYFKNGAQSDVAKFHTMYAKKVDPNMSVDDICDIMVKEGIANSKEDAKYGAEGISDINKRLSAGNDGRLGNTIPNKFTIGLGITNEYLHRGKIDWRGRTVDTDPVKGAEQIATYAMILRDPRFETFRVFYVKGDKIVANDAITTYLAGAAVAHRRSNIAAELADISQKMKRYGADGFYILHNHPSGDIKPSSEDFLATSMYSNGVKNSQGKIYKAEGFKGSIIIDHNKYTLIDENGNAVPYATKYVAEDYNKNGIPHALIGKQISSPEALGIATTQLVHRKNYAVILYASADNRIRMVQEVPDGFVLAKSIKTVNGKPEKISEFRGYVANNKSNVGGFRAFLCVDDNLFNSKDVRDLYTHHVFDDVVNINSLDSFFAKGFKQSSDYASNGLKKADLKVYKVSDNSDEYTGTNFSRRVTDTTNEILNQTERVQKDAAVLSTDIKNMAEQFNFTEQMKSNMLSPNRAKLVTDRLKKMPSVSADKEYIEQGLQNAYSEITQIFTENSKSMDKAKEIMAICETLADQITDAVKPIFNSDDGDVNEVIGNFSTAEQVRAVANEIYNNYWEVAFANLGDVAKEGSKSLKEKHAKAMHDLRLSHERAIDKLRKEKNEVIKQIREDRDHKLEEYKMYRDWQEAEHKQRAEKKAYVEKITDTAMTLADWLKRNDGKNMKSVPDPLKTPVTTLLESIDFSSKQLLGMINGKYSGMPTRKDRAIAESLNAIKDYMYESRFKDAQNQNDDENYFDIPAEIVADMKELGSALQKIADNNDGFVLNKMSTSELETLSTILTVLKTSITNINKRFNGKGEIDAVAIPDIEENRTLGQKENNKFKAFFEWANTLPQYAFEHLGKGATEMFQEIKDGWSKFAFHVQSIKDFAKQTYTGEEYKKWSENVKEYTINGHKVKMTDTQRMSLYCLAQRKQALQHMYQGGIEVAPYKAKNGKLVEQAQNVVLTQADIEEITGTLTDRQIEVAKALQNFMNTTCSDWMNEVTMKRWGIRGATEENYFPINVDDTSLVDTGEPRDIPKSIFKLLNMGFTKPLNEKASNPIVVDDIVDVFITHATDMAKYNSLALPVLDMHRYYNFKQKTENGDIYNMKKSIQTAYGRDAQKYVTKFLLDLNANREESRAGRLFKLAKGYKVAAVAGNLQVAALQPVAVMRAKMYLSNRDLAKGFTQVPKGIEEMLKYSGIAVWKDLSLFDTNVARGIDSQIKQNDSIKDKFVEKTMKLAEWADKMTWGAIWSACKNEQYRNGLRGEELIKATAKEFETVIYHTQVVDSTMTRSEIMRGNDPYSQMVTSFMSEPTISMNLLQDAGVRYFQDARRYGKAEAFRRNGKHIAKCAYIYALNAAVEAILRGLMGKYRDWDEESDEMLENMWKEFLMNLNPLGNLPLARDIVSKLQGYNVERMDMASFTSLDNARKSWEKVVKGEKDLDYKTIYRTMQALSQFTGIPISSLMRDGAALWNDTIGQVYPSLHIE